MVSFRCVAMPLFAVWVMPSAAQDAGSGYIGSTACGRCHAGQFESQSKTGHAHALRRALPTDPGPGSHAQWAFGAGAKATAKVDAPVFERPPLHLQPLGPFEELLVARFVGPPKGTEVRSEDCVQGTSAHAA